MFKQKQQYFFIFCKKDYLSHCVAVNVSFIRNVDFNKDRKYKRTNTKACAKIPFSLYCVLNVHFVL